MKAHGTSMGMIWMWNIEPNTIGGGGWKAWAAVMCDNISIYNFVQSNCITVENGEEKME